MNYLLEALIKKLEGYFSETIEGVQIIKREVLIDNIFKLLNDNSKQLELSKNIKVPSVGASS